LPDEPLTDVPGRAELERADTRRHEQNGRSVAGVSDASSPGDISNRGWRDILRRSARAMVARNMSLTAAGVAFYMVWAFFPALVVLVLIIALLLGAADVMSALSQIRLNLPDAFNAVVTSQLDAIAERSRGVSISTLLAALALAMWSGTRGVHGLMLALNTVYGEHERRSFWHRQRLAFSLCLALGVFVTTALTVIVGYAGGDLRVAAVPSTPFLLVRWPILAVVLLLMLSTIYRYAPCRAVPKWRWVTWGAAVAAAIWMCGSFLLSYYAAHFSSFNPLLGSLTSVMIFLFWCYSIVLAVLLGAQINAELERHTVADTRANELPVTGGRPQP